MPSPKTHPRVYKMQPNWLHFLVRKRAYVYSILLLAISQMAAASEPDKLSCEIVALTILAEARGEGKGGMYRIACVIKQRSLERKIPPDQVCLQPNQFATGTRKLLGSTAAPYAQKLAWHLMRGHSFQRQVIGFANHFCTRSAAPYWTKGQKPTSVYGNHKFYRLR